MRRIEDINPFGDVINKDGVPLIDVTVDGRKAKALFLTSKTPLFDPFIDGKIPDNIDQAVTENSIVVKKSAAVGRSEIFPVKQVIFGTIPSKSNCYRIVTFRSKDPNKKSHATLAKTKELKEYENSFYTQCNFYRNANIEGEFEFEAFIYYPSRRADLDGSLKIVLDCLQNIKAIRNDRNCIDIHVKRFVDKNNPRIEFTLNPSMKDVPN